MNNPVDLGSPRLLSAHERLVIALQRGATARRAGQIAGVPEERAQLMLDHLQRAGMLRTAGQAIGCEQGACSATPSADPNVAMHCAGCPLAHG
ncbi:hypothetical protein H8R18_00865 [Nanchangia anserum]|uniref:Transcriptional regulator HTH-type FeoC domain-containing protein n=1 Tax=Nanchangia anserum TaxID=2692125 RepID=A0A8I0G8G1_9ACTO|nr:hypothetical protein [Nanchangia anserum]MBD3689792.1 hypothetical protein [Nanchangia anserum]QOX81966.1 hypothetical protein H8R18_00865 [Nanchangia anserum]